MKNPETEIELYFMTQVRLRGGFTRKYRSPGVRGVPDRIMFWKGVAFVEIKTAVGQLSPAQLREFKRINDQGEAVYVLKSKHEVDTFLKCWAAKREANNAS